MELGPNIQTVTTWYLYSSPNLGMTLDVSQDFEPFFQANKKKTEWMSGSDRFTESPKAEQGTPPHPKPTHPTSAKESERLRPEGDVFTSWRLKMAGKSSLKTGPLWLHDSDLRLIWTNHKYQLYKRGHKRYLPSQTHFPCCELTEIGILKEI